MIQLSLAQANAAEINPVDGSTGWRMRPGYLRNHPLSIDSVRLLLGRFLTDRTSADPLPEVNLFAADGTFEWGHAPPLEKVIQTEQDLELLLSHPTLYQTAFTLVEPWDHVGINDLGEEVRASKNIAFVAQKVADCDSILFPIWRSGVMDLHRLLPVLFGSLGVIVEGGHPSVYDPAEWSHPACSQQEMLTLIDLLIGARSSRSAPMLFICLGHQLAAAAHIRLLHRTVDTVLGMDALPYDPDGEALTALKQACHAIRQMGESLLVCKPNGHQVAKGWDDAHFAVSQNEAIEVGTRVLLPYEPPRNRTSVLPIELLQAHQRICYEDSQQSALSMMMRYEHDFAISMFHADEVNECAVLFANWAYLTLHEAIVPYRYRVAASALSGLLQLPYGVRILASTQVNDHTYTECSCTSILYKDIENQRIRYTYTCQFHPELLDDLRAIGQRSAPSYAELKQSDGIRLLLQFIYHGLYG